MKRVLVFALPLLFMLALSLLFFSRLGENSEVLPTALAGKPLPAFSLPSLDGGAVITEKDLRGPLLVNVWASWCPSCYEEHPYLLQLAQQGVVIIGLNYKDQLQPAQAFLAERGSPYRQVIFDAEGRLGLDLGVYGAPETFVIDAQGHISHRIVGILTPENFAAEIAPLLAAPPSPATSTPVAAATGAAP